MTQVFVPSHAPQGTALHAIIAFFYRAWLLHRNELRRAVPELVRREFERFLVCGDPGFGYAVLGCARCAVTRAIARSCKGRSWCPHCLGRRQAKLAPHIVDCVLGELPVRHWIMCVPPDLRFTLGYNPAMLTATLTAFVDAIFRYMRRKAKRVHGLVSIEMANPGAISVIHRCSGDLDTNVHFHVLVPEGVFIRLITDGAVTFCPLTPPTDEDIEAIAFDACRRTCAALERGKHWKPLPATSPNTVAGVLTFGERKNKVAKFFGEVARHGEGGVEPRDGAYAFHVNADHVVDPGNRRGMMDLVNYVLAPPITDDQVRWASSGEVLLYMKRARRDGSREVRMKPFTLLDRLSALVGRRKSKALRYHGVYAANASMRNDVMPWRPLAQPQPSEDAEAIEMNAAHTAMHAQHHDADHPACPHCSGRMTLVEVVTPRHTYRNPGWKPPDGWVPPRVQDRMGQFFGLTQ
jgi:hypothetical protein